MIQLATHGPTSSARPVREPPANVASILFVDLDGTLLATDLLQESLLLVLRENPRFALRLPRLLLQGPAVLKRALGERTMPDVRRLPYREEVLELLHEQRARGCRIVLATASDRRPAREVANQLGVFDDVLASDGQTNLKGAAKLAAIEAYCRAHGCSDWGYVGDAAADLPIWQAAAQAYVVDGSPAILTSLARQGIPVRGLDRRPARWAAAVRVLRLQQWVKNLLILAPLLLAHEWTSVTKLLSVALALLAFCLCASAVYVINDLLDIEADRRHPVKRRRPFASGDLPVRYGPPLALGLLLTGVGLAMLGLSWPFVGVLALYLATTSGYSLWLKRQPIIDVLTLAGLYAVRIFAGGLAADVPISEWLIAFSMFLFLSLALVKRYSELVRLTAETQSATPGRGYLVSDRAVLQTLGAVSGYLAVLVFALYTHSLEGNRLYLHPWALWLVCPVLIHWISRIWLLAARTELSEDPVVFAIKDRASVVSGFLALLLILVASFPG